MNSVRIAGDTNRLKNDLVYSAAMRWYKNRRLTNYDMDGKALLEIVGPGGRREIGTRERRAILTVCYAVTGRLLLTESFRRFTPQVLFDLGRVFPFHGTTLSARPLNAFLKFKKGDTLSPWVFDFPVSPRWHQVVLYNGHNTEQEAVLPLSGDTAFGALGLAEGGEYYLYDFWHDRLLGRVSGKADFRHSLAPGEAPDDLGPCRGETSPVALHEPAHHAGLCGPGEKARVGSGSEDPVGHLPGGWGGGLPGHDCPERI